MKYERLTKPCKRLKTSILDNYTGYVNGEYINRLQELEDKIENGTLVELPCKVGDKIYLVHDCIDAFYISELYVVKIESDEYGTFYSFNGEDLSTYKAMEDYNNTWFTDKAKAEERLKELNYE